MLGQSNSEWIKELSIGVTISDLDGKNLLNSEEIGARHSGACLSAQHSDHVVQGQLELLHSKTLPQNNGKATEENPCVELIRAPVEDRAQRVQRPQA